MIEEGRAKALALARSKPPWVVRDLKAVHEAVNTSPLTRDECSSLLAAATSLVEALKARSSRPEPEIGLCPA